MTQATARIATGPVSVLGHHIAGTEAQGSSAGQGDRL